MIIEKKIVTDRLSLEPLSINDAREIYEIAREKKSIEDFRYVSKNIDDVKDWLDEDIKNPEIFNWVIRKQGKTIGLLVIELGAEYSDIETDVCSIGFFIDYREHNQGFATESLRAVLDWLFRNTSIKRVEAGVTLRNIPSYRVLEKLGFIRDKVVKANWKWYDKVYDSVYYYTEKPENI